VGLASAYYWNRLETIKRQNKKLEGLVTKRTSELQESNEQLFIRQEEINTQNEELLAANIELLERQEEIAMQRDLLTQQNQKMLEAQQTIEHQNQEILIHNQTLDQQVKERTYALVEYNQQLEQFAFIAAHNLRAPVARLLGLGQILKIAALTPEEEKTMIEKITLTAEELDQVVKDLNIILEIKKNSTQGITEINLMNELVLIKSNLENEIQNTQAQIHEDFSRVNIIQTVKPYLDSILFNLISNAIKYRNPLKRPQIDINTSLIDNYVCLQVTDNGLGIDLPAYEKKLFTLYKRFHSHVEGKGMGLYLVKTQVEALGGKIEVNSQVNHGTTFKVYLKNNHTS
jgi:signal transduction histidine kinase